MSAINDALRRASSAAKAPPQTSSSSPLPPMNAPTTPPWVAPPPVPTGAVPEPAPVVTPPPIIAPRLHEPSDVSEAKKGSRLPLILVLLFLFCIGGGAALYFFGTGRLVVSAREKFRARHEESTDEDRVPALFAGAKSSAQVAKTSAASKEAPAPPRPVIVPATTPPAPKPNPPVALAAPIAAPRPIVAPSANVHFPPLRLQSIFYRPGNASVMINGKTLFIGDEINGVTITDIQSSSVTLLLSGQTNVLTLR